MSDLSREDHLSIEDLQSFLKAYEWVNRPTRDGRKGYWRRKPYTRDNPTTGQLRARLRLAETSFATTDETGKRVILGKDGKVKVVTPAAQRVQAEMTGKKFVEEKPKTLPFYLHLDLEEARRKLKELLAET